MLRRVLVQRNSSVPVQIRRRALIIGAFFLFFALLLVFMTAGTQQHRGDDDAFPAVAEPSCSSHQTFADCYRDPPCVFINSSCHVWTPNNAWQNPFGCRDGNCYNAACMAIGLVGPCKMSPHFLVPKEQKVDEFSLTHCVNELPSIIPPQLTQNASKLDAFKYFTAKPFSSSWSDWPGKCVPDTSGHDNMTRGGHEGPEKVFKLYNFCLRPAGRIMGFNASVGVFEGGDDVETLGRERQMEDVVAPLFSKIDAMLRPSDCYFDTKLIMMPVFKRSRNPGHVFHRSASLNRIRQVAFPYSRLEDVTTVYVMPQPTSKDYHGFVAYSGASTAHAHFMRALSGSYFHIFGHDDAEALRKVFGSEASDSRIHAPMCFREMAVYFTCTHEECVSARESEISREIAPMYNHRSGAPLSEFVERVLACSGLERRPAPNRTNPRVLLSVRTGSRRWRLMPQIISALGEYVQTEQHGELLVAEMNRYTNAELVHLYHSTDIVIGPMGSGLVYGVLMPPGSVVIEVNTPSLKCTPSRTGINLDSNVVCEFGGNSNALGINHVIAALDGSSECADGHADPAMETIVLLVQSAVCMLRRNVTPPSNGSSVGCPDVSDSVIHSIQTEHRRRQRGALVQVVMDVSGNPLAMTFCSVVAIFLVIRIAWVRLSSARRKTLP